MFTFKALPFFLLVLVVQATGMVEADSAQPPVLASKTRVPRLVRRAQHSAMRGTQSLANDLRVAFRRILPRSEPEPGSRHVVYCKHGQQALENKNPKDKNWNNSTASTSKYPDTTQGQTSTTVQGTDTGTSPTATPLPQSPWALTSSYEGDTFFQGWDFFTLPDPTHGTVDYIDEAAGRAAGIVEINSAGHAIMRVETTPTVPGNRRSIRITTQLTYTGALVIMDAVHMPTGCATWPAFWSNGPNWPVGGEIDILEAVNDYTHNQATLHTSAGCTLPDLGSSDLRITGNLIAGRNCDVGSTSNQGCGIRANSPLSYGQGFNENRGGVYAMQWDTAGIAIYFFPRGLIPDDIEAGAPQPDTWGAAQARFPADTCDPFQFFRDHHAIFDTTLCGDWAGGVWNAAGVPGQEESCAQRTGFSTCEAYVRANGAAFAEAYWEVRNVKIYQLRN